MEDEVIRDIQAMIQLREEGLLSPTCCIYKVPHTIRDLKEDSYTPKAVSIGPFHYRNERFQNMERHKQVFFKRFMQVSALTLDDLVKYVKELEPSVRASYSENINLSENELVKVILVDACFIIELFKVYNESGLANDSKLSQPWLFDTIIKDLLLLENQLPFFVLEGLFNRSFSLDRRGNVDTFLKLTYNFFYFFNIQNLEPNPNVRIKHFTDLLRLFHLQAQKPPRPSFMKIGNDILSYSANELSEAGVKFKASKSKCLLDMKFTGHDLVIPQITMEDTTETLYRNMIALEQCHYPYESYITDYLAVLHCLISTSKDVDVLVHEKIIRNYHGDTDDVAKVFNGLWKNVVQANFNSDYLDMCKRLNEVYQNPWHELKATLKRDYCKTPWQTAASIAGIVILILSLIQTIFSILQVVMK